MEREPVFVCFASNTCVTIMKNLLHVLYWKYIGNLCSIHYFNYNNKAKTDKKHLMARNLVCTLYRLVSVPWCTFAMNSSMAMIVIF